MKKSKRTSIRTKITLSLAATILIMVVMSCALTMVFIKKYFYHSMEQMLLDTYNSCNELFGRDEDIDSKELANDVINQSGAMIFIFESFINIAFGLSAIIRVVPCAFSFSL